MYHHDGLQTVHNSSFLENAAFKDAYSYTRDLIGKDYDWMWRNYIGISLASNARHNSLNFVECGVGEGWMSISILRYFARNYNITPSITLFDTWSGIDEKIVDPEEIDYWGCSVKERKAAYIYENSSFTETRDRILKTALHPRKIEFVQGSIPKSLTGEVINRINGKGPVSFLHIDMNNSVPEVSAMEKLYPIVSKGGIILLDDYAYVGYEFQKQKIDLFCDSISIDHPIALPSGQGLLIRTT
ncbi:class I SAM-dependent methyltransferase [Synechococcus sp. SYN20]|uniref:class I SAM-dependent methyltransferase n=1 Tax=Synechococcus sp. SYN20 TaxID=1050714 RepID=UPI00164679F0|nr:class I SAM-dependent methyltransferase [Synechococcus sp. SYN20]